ncbi:hypothetical protein I350_07860 [Cryptococcus amylolentus CBS 6273]|uniref:Uncharacterized protein n=1 Tax=Cryptococcus amylolentus CBS 6273 TaxID=1296118 RepID=A0A1E3JBJ0_9TREE|nr:hypothetical protein I350_07860 [Cryptococcus amylolentus CBS 6273]
MSDNRSTRSNSPAPDAGTEDRQEVVLVYDSVLADDISGSTATAGGPSQQELENPFRQPPEGSDDDENEEQVPEREFPDGITFAISGYQSLMPGNPRLHLRTPASRSNLTLQEWTEKLEEEGGINWRDGSSRSLEFGIVTMLYPANQERQNTIIAIVRRDLERAYEDGTDFFDHTSEDPDSTQS